MKTILKNSILEKELSESGFIVIPFLTNEEVSELKEFYFQHHDSKLNGMYATAHISNIEMRMQMNNYIKDKFKRAISQTFINHNPLGGSYIAKGKGPNGTLNPHQDWNIVDEDYYRSFNVWVPLIDLNENNGSICIMPGSHLWKKTYRSANIQSVYQNQDILLWKMMNKLHMKAGDALIYDHRLIHASGENKTDQIRLAAVFGVIPDETKMIYYHRKDERSIEIYESNPEFFLYGNIFEGPKGLNLIDSFAHLQELVSMSEFYKLSNIKRPTILNKVKSFFN